MVARSAGQPADHARPSWLPISSPRPPLDVVGRQPELNWLAQRYYVLAVQLAKLGGDDMAVGTLAALVRQCYDLSRADNGLDVVRLAQYGTRRSATARLHSLLATREAWGYAQRGDVCRHRARGTAGA